VGILATAREVTMSLPGETPEAKAVLKVIDIFLEFASLFPYLVVFRA
jgi:hypothetical protein